MNLLYTLAKAYVSKKEEKEQDKKQKLMKLAQEAATKFMQDRTFFLSTFFKKYEQEKMREFKEKNIPLFSIGEKVITNWYGQGDSWEGTVESLQKHTPYKGPIDVEITAIVLDTQYLFHRLELCFDNGIFNNINPEMESYDLVVSIFENKLKYYQSYEKIPWITWAYRIIKDDTEYWHYSISERKFLKSNSRQAKLSLRAWDSDVKIEKLREEIAEETGKRNSTLSLLEK